MTCGFQQRGIQQVWLRTLFIGVCAGMLGAGAEEATTVIGHVDSLSGDSAHYVIIRDTEAPPEVQLRTQIFQGDHVRIGAPGETMVIEFTDGSREELGPVAGLYGPFAERGREATLLTNLLRALADTIADFRTRPVTAVATAARGEGGPIVMGELFTAYPLVLAEGRRSLFFRWGGGSAPYRVRMTNADDSAAIIEVNCVENGHLRTEPVDLLAGDYAVEIADTESRFGFRIQVVSAEYIPADIAGADMPAVVAAYINAFALATEADNTWVFESYQRLATLAQRGYEPAGVLMEELEEGEARHWGVLGRNDDQTESGCCRSPYPAPFVLTGANQ